MLSFRADIRAKSANPEKRTVELTWTTGARVQRGGFWSDPFLEELSLDPKHVRMERLQSGRAPLLDSHSSWGGVRDQLGVVESADVGDATVRFSKREAVEEIFQDVVDGILGSVSVGYRVYKYEKVPPTEGDAAAGDQQLPVYRAVDWEPYEISLVSMPADVGAVVRGEKGSRTERDLGRMAPCVFVTRGEETTMDPTTQQQPPAPAPAPAPATVDDVKRGPSEQEMQERGVNQERERAAQISGMVRKHKLDDAFAADLVKRGVTVEKAREAILEKLAERSDSLQTVGQHIQITDDQRDKFVRGAGAWLIQRSGQAPLVRDAIAKKVPGFAGADVELDPGEFRGMTLMDLARESLTRRGIRVSGLDRMQIAALAIGMARDLGGVAGTTDFAVLLENTLHKVLLGAYAATQDTWSRVCRTDSVTDFRAHPRYRLGSFSGLDAVAENGEFKNKAIPDGLKLPISVTTKGNIIGVTRQALVNDDMGALAQLATMLGRAARLQIELDFYALLGQNGGLGPNNADGQPFFHANRANVNATGSALSAAGIDADRVVMAQQKDPSNNEVLDLRPSILLVPVGLGGEARIINTSLYDPDVTGASAKFMRPNKVVGLFKDVVDTARLSGTRRYLFTDPGMTAAFVVAFLEGQQVPFMEQQLGWRMDGIEWKVRLDYGVSVFDPRGAVTNAGV